MIREMFPEDVEDVLDLVTSYIPERAEEAEVEEEFFQKYVEKKREDKFEDRVVLVDERLGEIVGEIEIGVRKTEDRPPYGRIYSLCVAKKRANRLVGPRLMKAMENYLRDEGCDCWVAAPLKKQRLWHRMLKKYGCEIYAETDNQIYYHKGIQTN